MVIAASLFLTRHWSARDLELFGPSVEVERRKNGSKGYHHLHFQESTFPNACELGNSLNYFLNLSISEFLGNIQVCTIYLRAFIRFFLDIFAYLCIISLVEISNISPRHCPDFREHKATNFPGRSATT